MKIKFLVTMLLLCSIISDTTLFNGNSVDSSFDELEYTEVNPFIFDFWW